MKTIFEGTINGEKFNSVQAYNARMIELMNAGAEVNASSHTKSVNESAGCDCRCTCDKSEETCAAPSLEDAVKTLVEAIENDDEVVEVTLYPYFGEDDPHYLDTLVDDDAEVNDAVRHEVNEELTTYWLNIAEYLFADDVCNCEKKEYMENIREIIKAIEADNRENIVAMTNIKKRRKAAEEAFAKAEADYELAMAKIASEETVLNGANNIITDFLEFYRHVEAEGIRAIKEQKDYNANDCNCNKIIDRINNINTNCKEINPQLQMDLAEAFGKLFEGVFNNINLKKLN